MFFKRIKSMLIALLIVVMFMGSVTAYASTNNQSPQDSAVDIIDDELSMYNEEGTLINTFSTNDETIYIVEITDKEELKKYEKPGEDILESRTITYILPKEDNNLAKDEVDTVQSPFLFANYTVGSWKYIGNRYYTPSQGTPFRVEGKAKYTYTTSTSTTWDMYGEGSGKVKGLVEVKIGGKIGAVNKKDWKISVDVPEGYYRDFEVWEYLSKYTFNVLKDNKTYSTGCSAYKPNGGQKLTNDLYKKR